MATSRKVATISSEILNDDRFSDKSKSSAGSALAQTKHRRRRRKNKL